MNSLVHGVLKDIAENESHHQLQSTCDSTSQTDAVGEEENEKRTRVDNDRMAKRLNPLMVDKSYKQPEMSTEGSYVPISPNDPTFSKPSHEMIARKNSMRYDQTPAGRRMVGSGMQQQSLLDMVRHRKSSLPASADTYVHLMGASSKFRAGHVATAESATVLAPIMPVASTSQSSNATTAAASIVNKKGSLNLRMAKLQMMTRRVVKGANTIEKFAKDDTHLKYINDTAEMFKLTIPVPIQISTYIKVMPILKETCKTYNSKFGRNHQLTKQAFIKHELFANNLASMIKTMG